MTDLVNIGPADIAGAMNLVTEAGWNQLPADWQLISELGEAMCLHSDDGKVSASALALPYSAGFGWISMVLVAKAHRRRGLATRLLNYCITWLQERDLTPILDATPDGARVYEKLGFVHGEGLTRWQGVGFAADNKENGGEARATPSNLPWIFALDADVFGADRTALLQNFLSRTGSYCLVKDGFVIIRQGRTATQLGPLTAQNEVAAKHLLEAALAVIHGPVFLDCFDSRTLLSQHLSEQGFTKQRSFTRMSLGTMPDFDGEGKAMVIAGPEYG